MRPRSANTATTKEPVIDGAAIPQLRFPKFSARPIRSVSLGDVTEDCTDRNGPAATDAPIMGVSKTDGIVPMEERLIGKDTARYKRLEPDWFAYNPMRLNIGSVARWKGKGNVLVSPDYIVFRCLDDGPNTISPEYLDHFRSSTQWEDFVTGSGDGGVRVRIYYRDLARLRLGLPEPDEQQKIADCLTSLDDLIAAQGRKVEALKAHKKGLMQHLFPREGQTTPRLRFPEFRDGPEWEERSAGEFFANRKEDGESGLPIYSVTINDGMVPRASIDRDFYDIEDPAGNKMARKGDIAYNMMRMWQGAQGVAPEDCLVSPAYVVLAPKSSARSDFFGHLFKLPQSLLLLTNHSRGLTKDRLRLYFDDFARMPLRAPDPAEQQRIADCLASLDEAIAAAAAGLTVLKTHKKGLMQGLFPAPA